MQKNELIKFSDSIYRILEINGDEVLITDCIKRTMPKWMPTAAIQSFQSCEENELLEITGMEITDIDSLDSDSKRFVYEHYTMIAPLLPICGDLKQRRYMMKQISEKMHITTQTIRSYFTLYLAFQDIAVFAPKQKAEKKELTKDEPRMEVLKLQTKYPQGGERQLIYATTGRAINSSMLPADAGCVVDNVATISAIYRAVAKGEPSMDRIVTVSGDAVHEPGNFKVPFGMNQAELIEAAGGYKVDPEKIISGGPMMGFSMFTVDVPVTRTSSSILCFTKDEVAQYEPTACINCGRCVEVCPSRLIPSRLADYAEHHDEEAFTKHEGLECMECGSCSYVCPAKRQLKQAIGSMRKTALANRKKK